MTITMLQFGTSRFLQAHFDLFAGEARRSGQELGRIGVVQTTNSPRSRKRIEAFKQGAGHTVRVRGRQNGELIDKDVFCDSIENGYHAQGEWDQVLEAARGAELIVSNTGDGSYEFGPQDLLKDTLLPSFPGKLLQVLSARYRSGGAPPVILPCELRAAGNGSQLKELVLRLAELRGEECGFVEWLADGCVWADTLVDRIVSGDLDPVGAVTEPFALLAVANQAGLHLPFEHGAIDVCEDLQAHVRLKLYLLNVAHMVLVARWEEDRREYQYCRQAMENQDVVRSLEETYEAELLPTFEKAGMQSIARDYVATTLERFANPYLDHKFTDMIVDYPNKVHERIGGFLKWSDQLGVPARQYRLRRQLLDVCGV